MLNKQEQEILDNAPEGAEEYGIETATQHGTYLRYNRAMNYCPATSSCWVDYDSMLCSRDEESIVSLADLRKRQGKTVWDAVNKHKGVFPDLTGIVSLVANKHYINTWFSESTKELLDTWQVICTIEEFNQCVKEMIKGNCEAHWGLYSIHDKQLLTKENSDYSFYEPTKPRTKVEYVGVDNNSKGGKFWECARDFAETDDSIFYSCDLDVKPAAIVSNEHLIDRYRSNDLYRKVETEITWQDELRYYIASCSHLDAVNRIEDACEPPKFDDGDCWDKEFIDMCHLVSSMNK